MLNKSQVARPMLCYPIAFLAWPCAGTPQRQNKFRDARAPVKGSALPLVLAPQPPPPAGAAPPGTYAPDAVNGSRLAGAGAAASCVLRRMKSTTCSR